MTGLRGRHLPIAVAYGVPPDLSIAWLAVAPLYLLGPRGLPEPIVALLVSTTVGVFSAVVKAGLGDRAPTAPVARPQPPARLDPSVHPPPRHPPTHGHRASMQDRPTTEPAARSTADIDYDSYPGADPAETQCPNCGGFSVARRSGRVATAHCATCGSEWRIGDGIEPPDVVVRSWLSGSPTEPR